MPTINAIDSNIPIEVTKGGTGQVTLTSHGVLVGNGTSGVAALSVGSTGQLLVGASASDPAFGSSASGDFTFTTSTAGATRTFTVSNTDNSNTSSNSAIVSSVGGTSSGDAYHRFAIGTSRSYAIGPDTSSSQTLKINTSSDATATPSSGTNLWNMTSAGVQGLPLQPAFCAYKSSSTSNVTGDDTAYTVIFDTEVFDQASNYNNSTGVFTAPVAGRYAFACSVRMGNLSASFTTSNFYISSTGGEFFFLQADVGAMRSSTVLLANGSVAVIDMAAGDTCSVVVSANGGTKTVSLDGQGGGVLITHFSGVKIC